MLARTIFANTFSPCSQPLPVLEAMNLYAALETIFDVIAGLRCQPRFAREDAEAGTAEAGDELDEMTNTIADRMAALIEEIRAARPAENFLQRRRAEFLLKHAIGDEPRVSDIATAAVRAVFQDRF
jgi:hypothetical protein